ncbi:MAG: PRC-barrel domain-containing protein [Actinomycetota bacterium]|nr:PRC-barrel domain-containing protein [Actinomycetota bacterium]
MPAIEHLHAGATAAASDGVVGSVTALIFDPALAAVTHMVVTNADIPGSGRIVALRHVTVTGDDRVLLDLSRAEVLASPHFVIPGRLPRTDMPTQFATYWVGAPGSATFATHEQLPDDGEVALRAHLSVRTSDGRRIGTVAELLVDPDGGKVTAISLLEGHIFGRREVSIPVTAIVSINRDGVTTNLDRSAFAALPMTAGT